MTLREYINSLSDEDFLEFLFPGRYMVPCYLCKNNKGDRDGVRCELQQNGEANEIACKREIVKSLSLPLATMKETSVYCVRSCKDAKEKDRSE